MAALTAEQKSAVQVASATYGHLQTLGQFQTEVSLNKLADIWLGRQAVERAGWQGGKGPGKLMALLQASALGVRLKEVLEMGDSMWVPWEFACWVVKLKDNPTLGNVIDDEEWREACKVRI